VRVSSVVLACCPVLDARYNVGRRRPRNHQLFRRERSIASETEPQIIGQARANKQQNKRTSKLAKKRASKETNKQANRQTNKQSKEAERTGPTGLRQVLWINQHQRGDYMRDQLMVGMRHLAGAHMVDWVKVPSASG
jgi:hypothetical protein